MAGNTAEARAKVANETLRCVGFQDLSITTNAQTLTLPDSAQAAQCQVQDQPVRWRADGTAPTASVGAEANDGDEITIQGRSTLKAFQIIRHSEGSAGGKLVCHYYG